SALILNRRQGLIPAPPHTLPPANAAAAGIRALYFRDPDDHPLELIFFPDGKGDARWHVTSGALFLGIDHTAIVVADTERSARFYMGAFGFRVVGGSLNSGIEQDRLNGLQGARGRLRSLRGQGGPGIDLLRCAARRGGGQFPPDTAAGDLWFPRTVIEVGDLASALAPVAQSGGLVKTQAPAQSDASHSA